MKTDVNILFAKLTLKNGTKIRISKEVILETATHYKGEEIIKNETIKILGIANQRLIKEEYEQIQNTNNSNV